MRGVTPCAKIGKNSAILYHYYLGATPIVHVVFREKGGNFPNFRKEIKEEINKKNSSPKYFLPKITAL